MPPTGMPRALCRKWRAPINAGYIFYRATAIRDREGLQQARATCEIKPAARLS